MNASDLKARTQSALAHTGKLMEIGPRGSTTDRERAASQYVFDRLSGIGLRPSWEEFRSPKSAWLPFALCFLLPILAYISAFAGSRPGMELAFFLTLLSAWWFLQESKLERTLLNRLLPHGTSQNVFARIPSTGQTNRKIVFLAHVDTHRTPVFFTEKRVVPVMTVGLFLAFISLFAEASVYLLMAVGLINLNLLWMVPFLLIQLALFALLIHPDRTPFSPGANDNAASVGIVLALAEHYHENPDEHTEIMILATGCEEVGCYGIRDFLPKHRAEVEDAVFVDFELVGIGRPSLVTTEGLLQKQPTDEGLIRSFQGIAARLGMDMELHQSDAYGETYVINRRGLRGITLNCIPEAEAERYWHTLEDTLDKIQSPAVEATIHLAEEYVREVREGI